MKDNWYFDKNKIEDTKKRINKVVYELDSLRETLKEYEKEINLIVELVEGDQKNRHSPRYNINRHITGSIKNKTIECKKTMTKFAKHLPVNFWNYKVEL